MNVLVRTTNQVNSVFVPYRRNEKQRIVSSSLPYLLIHSQPPVLWWRASPFFVEYCWKSVKNKRGKNKSQRQHWMKIHIPEVEFNEQGRISFTKVLPSSSTIRYTPTNMQASSTLHCQLVFYIGSGYHVVSEFKQDLRIINKQVSRL